MMRKFASMLLTFLLVAAVRADEEPKKIRLGEAPPAITDARFLQGQEFSAFEKDKVYVVEFWATWCGPCVASIPPLNKIAKQHPEVVVTGFSIDEKEEAVADLLKGPKTHPEYRVAVTSAEGEMATQWLAGHDGIPTAFVIGKESTVLWVGHPNEIDQPLEKILKGEWDVKEFAEKFERVKLKEALTDARKTEIERLVSEEKFAKALKKLEVFLEEDATQEEHFGTTKFWCLLQLEKYGAAIRYGNDLLKQYDDDMEVLLTVAGMIVAPEDVQIGANAESEDEMPGDGDSPDMPKDKEKEKEKDDLRVQNQPIPARNWVAKEDADEGEATPAGKDAKPEKGKIPSGLLKIAIRAAERALVLATEESDWPSRIQATTYLSKAHVAAGRVRPARKAIEAAIETLKEEVEERQAYLEALDDQLKALGEKKKKGR